MQKGGASSVEPERHQLSRERISRKSNRGAGKKKKTRHNKTDPKIKASVRVLQFPLHPLDVKGGDLWCSVCSCIMPIKKSSIRTHLQTQVHKNNLLKSRKKEENFIRNYAVLRDAQRQVEGENFTVKTNVTATRMQICYAFLFDNVSFEVLNDPVNENGFRYLLEENRGTLPYRDIRDLIKPIRDMLTEELMKELKEAGNISIIFDGTPNVAEVFGIIFRFWKGKKITHRLATLQFFKKSFDKVQLGYTIIDILSEFGLKRVNIRAAICDGCPVNHAALTAISGAFNEMADPICISHSACVVGKEILVCLPLAKRFEEKWSQMNETSFRSRQLFSNHSGESCLRASETRWYSRYEIIVQIYDKSGSVNFVVGHADEFSESLRSDLKDMIQPALMNELRMELAVAKDTGDSLVKLCYFQEGDEAFLSATTFDHWMKVMEMLRKITSPNAPIATKRALLPSVVEIASTLSDNVTIQNDKINEATAKVLPVYEKMIHDTNHRLARTLRIYRACRLFNYQFIAEHDIETIKEEVIHLLNLNICFKLTNLDDQAFLGELYEYKRVADLEMQKVEAERPRIDVFWLRHTLTMPNWYVASRDVGLITPSSATIERAFSLLTQGFCSSQTSLLEDAKSASCVIRFNENWKKKDTM
jgi:hypothetical protein